MIHLSVPAVLVVSLLVFKACNGEDVSAPLAIITDKTIQAAKRGTGDNYSALAKRMLSDDTARSLGVSEQEIQATRNLQKFGGNVDELTTSLNVIAKGIDRYKLPNGNTVEQTQVPHVENKTEYTVIELPKVASRSTLMQAMNAAGAKGWDCFHVETVDETMRMMCKRQKVSPQVSRTKRKHEKLSFAQIAARELTK